jgi:anaerobic selenocysteine-containing dehydrogenase
MRGFPVISITSQYQMKNIRTVSTLCRMCPQNCGIEVTVEDGQPVHLKGSKKHPFNKGWLCTKGLASLDLYRSPERLTTPYIRKNGKLEPVGWDEALSFAAEKLIRLKETYGPESVAFYYGEGAGHQEMKYYVQRFANVFGTPNFSGVGSICNFARTLADTLTLGGVTKPDIPNSKFLMIWGGNPFASNEPLQLRDIRKFKKRGGQLVVIDPRKTEVATMADVHLAIQPGMDRILILNMIHAILREDLWDKPFTEKWVHGFEDFYQTVTADRFSPERGEAVTGISADIVRNVARSYAETKPAGNYMGNGLEHHASGIRTMRLVAIMKAITGNVDVPGGDLFTYPPKLKNMTKPLPDPFVAPVGLDDFPVFCTLRKEARALSLPRAILEERPYPIKGMVITSGNTTMEWPNSQQVRKALQKLEFLMVIDIVNSPDSRYADVILPACTFFERDEHHVNIYQNLHSISLRQQVVEPKYGLPDQMIWVALAKAMGYEKYFPWKNCREGIDYLLEDLGVTYQQIISMGGVYEYDRRRYRQYEEKGFRTVTGKVEIFSEKLKSFGFDPFAVTDIDTFIDSDIENKAFPLSLTTGGNLLPFLHWQYRYIPRLRKLNPEPLFEIHPTTAEQYGVSENEIVEITTKDGSIQLKARITETICPDTLHIPQGWEAANANELTSPLEADPISGFPNLKSLKCRVRKVKI